MKLWLLVVWILFLTAGCRVNREPMDAAHAERVSEIDSEFDREIAENDERWNDLKTQVLERRQYLIEVDAEGKPTQRVITEFAEPWNACFISPIEAAHEGCKAEVRRGFWRAVGGRYFKADFDGLERAQQADPDLDIETWTTKSHNERLETNIKKDVAEIERHKADFRDTMNGYRANRIRMSADERDQEIESADQRRRAIWAAAIQGFAQGMQNASQASSARSNSSIETSRSSSYSTTGSPRAGTVETGCTSDFSCGMGQTCVKQFYNSSGVCMRKVNEYGGPSYSSPDLDSVGPNMPNRSSCTAAGASCPVGFRCDYGSGRCIK